MASTMPQQPPLALFFSVAFACVIALTAAVFAFEIPNGYVYAGCLYAASLALTALTAYNAHRRHSERLSLYLLVLIAASGPFGAGIGFIAGIIYSRSEYGTATTAEWINNLFDPNENRETDLLHERISFGLDDFESAAGVEPFRDILSGGSILQKQMAIAKIARYFRPAFAPLLLQAARDKNAAVRVQAATALAKIERDFMARYIKLENDLRDLPDHDPAKLALAELYDDYAHADLLDDNNRHELRQKAITIYEACLAQQDTPDWRLKLGASICARTSPRKPSVYSNRCWMRIMCAAPCCGTWNPSSASRNSAICANWPPIRCRLYACQTAPRLAKSKACLPFGKVRLFGKARHYRVIREAKMPPKKIPDVCLILEGTYPYVAGGVSSWTHELIKMHSHLTFTLVALVSRNAPTDLVYDLPANVVNLKTVRLQELPPGQRLSGSEERILFAKLEESLRRLQSRAHIDDLAGVDEALTPFRAKLGSQLLLDSSQMWELLLRLYQTTMPKTAFLDYFWSWRGLFGGLFSILLADLPEARVYHSMCTGYAGLMLARAKMETGRPCIITEHGIYTNERRIEIASADWIDEGAGINLAIASASNNERERDLKDLWIDTFSNYSRFCYEAATEIITLFEGNQEFQRMDGASAKKLHVIPNGIDGALYDDIQAKAHPPTVALIGRVVPIKDIKTYIKAVHILKQSLPDLVAYVLGPADEDPSYARECRALVEHLRLNETVIFTGKVNVIDYFSQIDVNVLTSLSEAQPLVVLEAGAAGIPSVATDVGACREMILGASWEKPVLGHGGAVVTLGSPSAVAEALKKLLTEPEYYAECSKAIRERVRRYYTKSDQRKAYADLYEKYINAPDEAIAEHKTPKQKAAA